MILLWLIKNENRFIKREKGSQLHFPKALFVPTRENISLCNCKKTALSLLLRYGCEDL
jgi:hypothetical protein